MSLIKRMIYISTCALILQGCATVIEGTDQTIPVYTNTASAICDITQKGRLIASTYGLKSFAPIGKSREPLTVMCSAPGYASKTITVPSVTSSAGVVSFWFWDLAITDWISGGLNRYPSGGIAIALHPVPGQEQLRRDALAETLRQPAMITTGIARDEVRPGRLLPYPSH